MLLWINVVNLLAFRFIIDISEACGLLYYLPLHCPLVRFCLIFGPVGKASSILGGFLQSVPTVL